MKRELHQMVNNNLTLKQVDLVPTLLTLQHVPVSSISDCIDVRWAFLPSSAFVHVNDLVCVNRQPFVWVHHHTEQSRVGLRIWVECPHDSTFVHKQATQQELDKLHTSEPLGTSDLSFQNNLWYTSNSKPKYLQSSRYAQGPSNVNLYCLYETKIAAPTHVGYVHENGVCVELTHQPCEHFIGTYKICDAH